ncbi:Glucocorticoid modulatory element-binding protein 2 [Liparis tanakae]|uniref:Glucocorticoid modulatory element-binding protein 2 n=1 Tax=Liparis tanakae TaxID=230148 RepID=A0A4Z2FQ13_9TELE|nr:Glucocorticoid modulatory element-binding protein 2 [Liparis tanakae]
MLRKIMDSGELDFYQHATVCSNTCRSTKIDLVGTKVSVGGDPAAELLPVAQSADMNGAAVSYPDVAEETSEWVTAIGEDSVAFWRTVKEAGLLEEVVEDFQKELQEVLQGLQERVCDPPLQVKDAVLLNNIVQNFGMLDLVKKVLASHKSQMDRYREQYTRSLAGQKRAKELKSKSQHLNNVLMTLAPAPAPPPPKRPRLTRAVSGPAGAAQVSLPLGQLTGLPLGKLLTVSGGAGGPNLGGYTLLTSSLSELGADGANLTLLTAGQDGGVGGGGFVKVLGPQFQLVTLQAALQSLAAAQHTAGGITLVDAVAAEEEEESQEESPAGGGGEEEESQQEQEDGEQQ